MSMMPDPEELRIWREGYEQGKSVGRLEGFEQGAKEGYKKAEEDFKERIYYCPFCFRMVKGVGEDFKKD